MSAEFYSEQIRTVKKGQTCDLCGVYQEVGERYHARLYKDGDTFYVRHLCPACAAILDDYHATTNEHDEDGIEDFLNATICDRCAVREECYTPALRCADVKKHYTEEVTTT